MAKFKSRYRVPLLSIWILALTPAYAQLDSGSIGGRIIDPSGSTIPRAAVTVWNGQTEVGSAQTDAEGLFRVSGIAPGEYTVRVIADGFTPFEQRRYRVLARREQSLNVRLIVASQSDTITVEESGRIELDPSSNAGALVLKGAALEALADDRSDLAADLQALAGPAAGPNGGQIYIDGFTGGRLPSKQSIREVRINQNPFSAQFDRPGQGRIEIFTKPGSEEFHGEVVFQFSDDTFNARNPFVATKPPYQRRQWEGEVGAPIGKHASWLFDFERRTVDENSFVNALTLGPDLQLVPVSQAVVTPLTGIESNLRVDRQMSKNHTLTVRYGYARDKAENQGVGGFSLSSRSYRSEDNENHIQLSETAVLNPRTVNETRFRYRRQRSHQAGAGVGATISVLDAVTSGGPPMLLSFNHQDRFEAQNFTSVVKGSHVVRWGGVVRGVGLTDQTTQNYLGTFTFTSLTSYRLTLAGLQNGLSPEQIRASGGGASQFSIGAGDPVSAIRQIDLGVFVQDDWTLRPSLTFSTGVRYETQNHTGDRSDVAPRVGFAWAPRPSKSKIPKSVVRGGFGIFYDRLSEGLSLDAQRLDGLHQQQFLISLPDFYPAVPAIPTLNGARQPQAIRQTDAGWRAPMMFQNAIAFERLLVKGVTLSTNYIHSRGLHSLRSRNINAPFSGSTNRPYGGVNNIYLYETSGTYRQHQWITSVNAKVNARVTLTGSYTLGSARSNSDGAANFPADQYDLRSEYGRAGFDIRHRVQFNGSLALPNGVQLSPLLTVASGRPYNIVTGKDLNGDSLFLDRPAFATDLNRPSIVRTTFGIFDTLPPAGQPTIPRNYAAGPGVVTFNLRLAKTFTLGREEGAKGKPSGRDPMKLTLSVSSRNLLNHANLGQPTGNLSSPLFGIPTGLAGGQAGSRRIDMQARFSF